MAEGKIKYTVLFVFLTMLQLLTSAANHPRSVLYINSYHNGFHWSDGITEGLKKCIKNHPEMSLHIEYLDAKKDSSFYKDPICLSYFERKYSPSDFNLVIVSDNDALDFVTLYQNSPIFVNKPILATGISDPENYEANGKLCIIKEVTTIKETFDIMKSFVPNLDTIFFISDNLKSGTLLMNEAEDIVLTNFKGITIKFITCIDNKTLGETVSRIHYPSCIFCSSVSIDCNGQPVDELEIAQIVGKYAKAPLFSGYYATRTDGYIGGNITTGEQMGKLTAETALKILTNNNQPVEKLIIPQSETVFDFRSLEKHNIPEHLLPAHAIVLNKPVTIWERSKKVILISLAIIINLLIVILLLTKTVFAQKKHKSQLLVAMEKANESDRLKTTFLENFSHEMRTPLNSIVGFSDVLLEMNTDPTLNDYVKIISENAITLNYTINHIFDFSLIKTHNIDFNLSKVNLNQLLDRAFETIAEEKRYSESPVKLFIEPDIQNRDTIVESDENKLYQVLRHLIDNAFKFTQEGEIHVGFNLITTTKELSQHPKNRIKLSPPYVLFFISDTGKGIKQGYDDLIFEPFRQAAESYTDANRGLGLGLSISKSLIEMLGGTIWIERKTNQGTTFYFTHPLKAEKKK